jgi:putative addiction module component (TIGR02574 family)
MSRTYEEIRDEAMGLPIEERGLLAEDLLDSLRTDEERAIEKEWIEVAERRLAEVEAGLVKPIPAEEAHKRVRAKLRAARRSTSRG